LVTKKDYCSSVRIIDIERTNAKKYANSNHISNELQAFYAYKYLHQTDNYADSLWKKMRVTNLKVTSIKEEDCSILWLCLDLSEAVFDEKYQRLLRPESIELFTEGQAFSRRMIWLLPHPPSPICKLSLFLSLSVYRQY
jgi:hypothetical protein